MGKKPEVRCASFMAGFQCVLRDGHIGKCLAWSLSDMALRWPKPKPEPCDRIVLVNYQLPNVPLIRYCNCTNAIGHNGPCEVRL